ncbi:acyl-CoA dehydrogenase family protein [Chloroflexota bacterium]
MAAVMNGLYEQLSEDEEMIMTTVKDLVKDKIADRSAEIDKTGEFPWDIVDLYRETGILSLPIPEEYGGGGVHELVNCMVLEEIAKTCANSAHALADHWLGITPLIIAGNEEQNQKFFTEWLTRLAAFSLTEPEAGSDASGVKTKAVLQGGEYVLNGSKCFCTDANEADFITVFAKTDPTAGTKGLSAFIVDKATDGISIGKIEDQMGMRGTRACEVILEDCHVPQGNLLGKEGHGFRIAMQTLDRTRCTDAALALGIAEGAMAYALDYAKERRQFGQAIADFQGIQFMLADMGMAIESARQLVYKASYLIDHGGPDGTASAMANCYATDIAVKVTNDAMQILGGYGYMRDYPLEQKMRDARLFQIVEGTNQVQRIVMARGLLA